MINRASFATGALRGPGFDTFFIAGIPALALLVGALVTMRPELFLLVFTVDLWLLGYHHVAATFTRVCFDGDSYRANRFMLFGLPVLVAGAVIAAVAGVGLWLIATVYLYWQWWHYTRQSEGIAKAYAGKNRGCETGDPRLRSIVHYAVPIAGILTVSARNPATYVFLPVETLPVPMALAQLAQVAAAIAVIAWLAEQWRLWRAGRAAPTYVGYMASHLVIYAVAYVGFEDPTRGWLVINMWHNLQYLAFVWLFNNRRFASGIDPRAVLLSTLSQTGNWWLYVAACLTLSTVFYYSAQSAMHWLGITNVAYLAVFYQVVNFHHYIVDSKIWKLRKPAVRQTVGLA
jgi:hypothetical protein